MSTEHPSPGAPVRLLSSKVLWVAGGLGIIATVIAAVLPLLVGVWQRQFALQADQAGYIAATELFAQVLGTGLYVWAVRRWSWRTCATAGLIVMAVGNLASAASIGLGTVLGARGIAGLGGGAVRALCMSGLARAVSPGLAFALYASVQVAVAASVTASLPGFILSVGPQVPFLVLAAIAAAGILATPVLPRAAPVGENRCSASRRAIPGSGIWAVVALFTFFLGQGALWTYLEPIGHSRHIPPPDLVFALSLMNIAGLAGALGVGALAHRMPPLRALLALLGIGVASTIALFQTHTDIVFIAASCGFYFAWCASFPFQFTVIARSDETGTACAAVPAVDGLGLASGAAMAGACIPALGIAATGWLCCAGSVIGVACYVRAAALANRRREPRSAYRESETLP